MSEEEFLETSTGEKIYNLDRNPELLKNKMTVFYGESGSGKTTIIEDAMHRSKHLYPTVFAISPSDISNQVFTPRLPPGCVKHSVSIKWISEIYRRQEEHAKIFAIANNMNIMRSVFELVANDAERRQLNQIIQSSIQSVEINKHNPDPGRRRSEKIAIDELRDKTIHSLFKCVIRKNARSLLNRKINDKQKIAVKFVDFNPEVLLILDDCAAEMASWGKSEVFKKLFYQGRNFHFTVWISIHGVSELNNNLRRNAHISIFTTEGSATAFTELKTSGLGKSLKKSFINAISRIFCDMGPNIVNHQKMIYIRGQPNPIRFHVAEIVDTEFKLGSPKVWELAMKLEEKNKSRSRDATNSNFTSRVVKTVF